MVLLQPLWVAFSITGLMKSVQQVMGQAAGLGVSSATSEQLVPLPGWRWGLLHGGILLHCFE